MERYETIRQIGKGSFGAVYLVSRKSDGAQFVLKRLPLKNVPTKELATYQNEVNLLRDLSHPSIVTYIDSYQHDSHMCIVMSYCEGGDLSHFLANRAQQHNPLPESEILYHFVQLVLAIHYMHEYKHIIHRDLKTQNVFIKNGLLQLGDLGISKALTSPTDFASTCIGTPYYMSPELFKNKPYNHKSDVWALGCILYEMCVMRHAFDANSINALASKIIRGDRAQLAGSFSPKLKELVGVMLDVNPSNRPSVKEILHLPIVKRAVRRFVHVVLRHSEFYRVKDVETFVGQVRRLGMGEMIDELSTPPPPASIGPAVGGVGGVGVGGGGENKEAKRTLELIKEEEREKQRLERKLAELKELQAEKERKVAERDRRVDRVERRRSSERAREMSAGALAADRRREEERRRADEERRRRERERDKLREYEREKEKQAREAEERRRKLLELNRDRQQRDAMEAAAQHKQQQQQKQQRDELSRQAAQRAARERVKTDRERRRREAERVEMERIRREREELNSGLREMEERASAISEKDRVLARKEREKREREGEERERLRAARKEYEAERAKAVEWNRAVVHGHHTAERKEREDDQQQALTEVVRRRVDRREDDEVYEEEFEDEEERQAVEDGKARIEQLTQHLHDYSKRLQTLKTTMQVTALIHEEDDEEEGDDDEDENEAAEAANMSVHLFVGIEERMRLLAKECVRRMGRDMFVRLFDAVGDARDRGESEEEIDSALQHTEGKTGDERWRHWRLIDQLLFMERHNESDEET